MTEDAIRNALSAINYPGFSRDIVSFGLVKSISVENGIAIIGIQVQTRDPKVPEQIFKECHAALDEMAAERTRCRSESISRILPAPQTPPVEWPESNPSRACRESLRWLREKVGWASRPSPPTSRSPSQGKA
jgi:hypothetical protein